MTHRAIGFAAPELTALRTLDNFRHRLEKDLEDLAVAGPAGVMPNRVETSKGEYVLDVWRYEKDLTRGA
jgi:hypothetical protein